MNCDLLIIHVNENRHELLPLKGAVPETKKSSISGEIDGEPGPLLRVWGRETDLESKFAKVSYRDCTVFFCQ